MYKLILNQRKNTVDAVLRQSENTKFVIPFAEDNTDYQAFLKYQAEGGKVYGADEEIPADEVTG